MSEYKVYWLKGIPRINRAYQEIIKKKQANMYRGKFVILQSIGIIFKVRKQGWSPTPADILVGI